ncbi:MAG TPA: hypothetical protein VGJ18_16500 [Gemmatimonadaceae bacterium]|jgi:hypothetical protein
MIARVWHGYTKPEDADAYEKMLKPELLPGISKKAALSPLGRAGGLIERDCPVRAIVSRGPRRGIARPLVRGSGTAYPIVGS